MSGAAAGQARTAGADNCHHRTSFEATGRTVGAQRNGRTPSKLNGQFGANCSVRAGTKPHVLYACCMFSAFLGLSKGSDLGTAYGIPQRSQSFSLAAAALPKKQAGVVRVAVRRTRAGAERAVAQASTLAHRPQHIP